MIWNISFYFNSFDGKEHFLSFIEDYNKNVSEEKEINYSDTTGILMSSVKTIVNAVSYVLIAFVSISLVVSSIMIGVITYISVYERTKEIGIRKSLGARRKDILYQFLIESLTLSLLGGIAGIIIGVTIGKLSYLFDYSFTFSSGIIILSVSVSILIGLIFGIFPAYKASLLNPIDALRSE